MSGQETLRGVLDHITFHSDETGYTVARLVPEKGPPTPIVGTFTAISAGEALEVTGEWVSHPSYGRQFRVDEYKHVVPSSVEGIKRYLGSGMIKGLGPVTAERIVAKFGVNTLDVIEKHPGKLRQVEGLGPKRAKEIRKAWQEQGALREVMVFLQGNGISPAYAQKIYRLYKDDTISIVKNTPYRLARDVRGIGFRSADKIALEVGIEREAPQRLRAGLIYVVDRGTENGHTFLLKDDLIESAAEQLDVDQSLLESALGESILSGELVSEDDRIALPELAMAEKEIARLLVHHAANSRAGSIPLANEQIIAQAEADSGITYEDDQEKAILAALKEGVAIITGGPGTGKTTTTLGIIRLLIAGGAKLALCAPTGRASKRLSEVTGAEAGTIHRLLGFQPERAGFQHNAENPLPADVVLVDEVSMVDTTLFLDLLQALRKDARLILVGDADQLPSVGPGQVLRDLIASGVLPVVNLVTVFRQVRESLIVTSAHRINEGEMPGIRNDREGDMFFLEHDAPADIAETIVDLVSRRLPAGYDLDPVRDIQVLAPMYRGDAGAIALNAALQNRLNPDGKALRRGDRELRVGDKVIITRNNYTKMVFNGDIGRINGLDVDEGIVHVRLDVPGEAGTEVSYESDELDELALAYAISVHRSQGSEFPVVVLPITTQHYMMLQRNLVYTAITRARKLMVMVGSKKALALAVRNSAARQRNTWLSQALVATAHRQAGVSGKGNTAE
jgi:exodeoxyribonuclease V alpha subunit